ncbi:MAG TPA: hypothetical protein DCW68_01355 [Rhodospirillaceae bacterium]|nr:MAG: hypothetical protein A2018_04320 [Alphaproteobacteria bacterium GWF2_58_20]HAU28744.1 hypothetical protein [Rhodospirillaceae bacterium]
MWRVAILVLSVVFSVQAFAQEMEMASSGHSYRIRTRICDLTDTSTCPSYGSGGGSSGEDFLAISPEAVSGMDVLSPATVGEWETFTVSNEGSQSSSAMLVSVSNAHFEIGIDTCAGVALPAGESCNVRVRPVADVDGGLSGTLMVSAVTGGTVSATLSGMGTGFAPTLISVVPSEAQTGMDVTGPATTGDEVLFTVSNTGSVATSVLEISLVNDTNFENVTNTCDGLSLVPAASCTVSVRPKAVEGGPYSGALRVHAANGGTVEVPLSGTAMGIGPAKIGSPITQQDGMDVVAPASSGEWVTFTIVNYGANPTTALTTTLTNTTNFEFDAGTNTCAGQILAGASSCSFKVRPLALVAGILEGNLIVQATTGGNATIGLSGLATGMGDAQLVISPVEVSDMHITPPETLGDWVTFTVRNIGITDTSAIAMSLSDSARFELGSDACTGEILSPGGACTVRVRSRGSSPAYLCAGLEAAANVGGNAMAALAGIISTSREHVLFPTDDSTPDRSIPTTNSGMNEILYAAGISSCNTGGNRLFMNFNLSSAPLNFDSAKIWVMNGDATCYSCGTQNYYFYTSNGSWTQDTITWNNMPARGTTALYGPITRSAPYSGLGKEAYDMSGHYAGWKSGAFYGLVIDNPTAFCMNGPTVYTVYSRESANVCYRPYLHVVENEAPAYTSSPVTWVANAGSYTYNVVATDSTVGSLDVLASTKPSWLTLVQTGRGTATLSGVAPASAGSHLVSLRAVDARGLATVQNFTVVVAAAEPLPNVAPSISSIPGTWVEEGETYSYAITAEDGDAGDTLTISAPVKPSWLSLSSTGSRTALLSGSAPATSGDHPVVIGVSDGRGGTVEQNFTITVSPLRTIVAYGAGRRWSNDVFAKNCYDYLTPDLANGYIYDGLTGDGIYTIKPIDGLPVDVWCDMTNDGGGWTLVMRDSGTDFDMPYPDLANTWVGNLANRQGVLSLKFPAYKEIAQFNEVRQAFVGNSPTYSAPASNFNGIYPLLDMSYYYIANTPWDDSYSSNKYTVMLIPGNKTDARVSWCYGAGCGCGGAYPDNYAASSIMTGTAGAGDYNYNNGYGCWGRAQYGPVSYEMWLR